MTVWGIVLAFGILITLYFGLTGSAPKGATWVRAVMYGLGFVVVVGVLLHLLGIGGGGPRF